MTITSPAFTDALIAGALAGTTVDTLFFPIDTLKTRLQSHAGFTASGGFSGVYRGLGSAVVGSAPGAAVFFTTYEFFKSSLSDYAKLGTKEAAGVHMISASFGELAACLVRVPTENVKQRSQASGEGKGRGSWDVAKTLWQGKGLRGFYRGFGTTVAREIPFTCLQFPLYERLKVLAARRLERKLWATEAALCGSIAGGVAAGLTTPLDVAKTRVMLSGSGKTEKKYPDNLAKTIRIIASEEGFKALWRGVVPRVIWISAGGAVFLGAYEGFKGALAGP